MTLPAIQFTSLKLTKITLIFMILTILSANALCQTPRSHPMPVQSHFSALIPPGYALKSQKEVKVDQTDAVLYRYERSDGVNNGPMGEHVSVLLDPSGGMKGFASYQQNTSDAHHLPSPAQAERVARTFLKTYAPDLLIRMEVHWVKPHDEAIQIQQPNGQTIPLRITGMKVKCRNKQDGRWFWVIVSSSGQPFVFERDIVWINFPGMRKTEKWLHDGWLLGRQ